MRKDYDIVGSYDNQRVSTISAERTINMFEYLDPEGKKPKVLLSTSGLANANIDLEGVAADAGSRASMVFKDAFYEVYGNRVYRTTGTPGSLSTSFLGELTAGQEGFVGIDANNYQVIFVDGLGGWIWDTTASTFEQITDTGFPTRPIDVCYLDGFFIVANGETNEFQMSLINNGMVWSGGTPVTFTAAIGNTLILTASNTFNFSTGTPVTLSVTGGGTLPTASPALTTTTTYYAVRIGAAATNPGSIHLATSYANAIAGTYISFSAPSVAPVQVTVSAQLQQGAINSHPGNIVACRTLHRRLFLFSKNYTEVWENAGIGTNLPVRRNNSLLMEVGTPSIGSISTGFDRMFFLSQDRDGLGSVMEVKGTESIPVSNRALDYALAQYASDPDKGVSDARGIMIKENGIIFYRLNFTDANHTYVLNVSMSTPDDPKWHEEEVLNGDRHPAQTHVYYEGVNYYGHYSLPILYSVDDSLVTNDGEPIRRVRIGKQMTPEGYNRLRIDRWHLDLLQGQQNTYVYDEFNLDAENSDDILTEDDVNIILDQQILVPSTQRPVVWLSISKDGGQTYGFSLEALMGKIGERTFRTVWRKLGTTPRGQGFVPKVEFFAEIPFVILGAAWDFEVLPE